MGLLIPEEETLYLSGAVSLGCEGFSVLLEQAERVMRLSLQTFMDVCRMYTMVSPAKCSESHSGKGQKNQIKNH